MPTWSTDIHNASCSVGVIQGEVCYNQEPYRTIDFVNARLIHKKIFTHEI